MINAKLLVHIL